MFSIRLLAAILLLSLLPSSVEYLLAQQTYRFTASSRADRLWPVRVHIEGQYATTNDELLVLITRVALMADDTVPPMAIESIRMSFSPSDSSTSWVRRPYSAARLVRWAALPGGVMYTDTLAMRVPFTRDAWGRFRMVFSVHDAHRGILGTAWASGPGSVPGG
ncbi:MAG: hypothetical protein ACE5HT_14170 [Gemmatimonadales bacterium]